MATMIPPEIPSTTPSGESILFYKLRDDPGTNGWFVLHSLDIRRHRTKAEGEIDMVILIPEQGILCLEVKGCEVSRHNGVWVYPYGTSVEGPFRQVSRGMHSLRDDLLKRDPSLAGLLFWSAVAFTRIHFDQESPEWHPWQVIDAGMLGRMPVSKIMKRIMERAHQHVSNVHRWYDEQRSRPGKDSITRLVRLLRGDFERVVMPRSDMQRIEESIMRMTEEQYDALDSVQENPRVVIKGLAGTGKTLLAIEAAKRAARNGKNVLLLCFNRLLADWLHLSLKDLEQAAAGSVQCRHLHGLLLDLAGSSVVVESRATFWRKELPEMALNRLLSDEVPLTQFDLLLVDEAQDILTEEYLDVLDLLLEGGLAGGRWGFFGDFEYQAIYLDGGAKAAGNMLAELRERAPDLASFTLRVNCRNARPITDTLVLACHIHPGYSRYLHEMEGAGVNPVFWRNPEDQYLRLEECVKELRKTFRGDEIVILSLNSDQRSCTFGLAERQPGKYTALRENRTVATGVRYASVHAFKGLESPAIIVTDIERLDRQTMDLLYVAMSRARVRLYLLMQEECRKDYNKILEDGLRIAMEKTA